MACRKRLHKGLSGRFPLTPWFYYYGCERRSWLNQNGHFAEANASAILYVIAEIRRASKGFSAHLIGSHNHIRDKIDLGASADKDQK
jgi:hypothetical protein